MIGVLIAVVVSAWTNTAGRVITAEPVRIDGQKVMMARGAVTNAYPLAAFMASEQKRIRRALGEFELPRKAAEVRTIFAADLARAEARTKAGRMTSEALAEKRKVIAGAWAHELEKHGLTEEERRYWRERLGNVGK